MNVLISVSCHLSLSSHLSLKTVLVISHEVFHRIRFAEKSAFVIVMVFHIGDGGDSKSKESVFCCLNGSFRSVTLYHMLFRDGSDRSPEILDAEILFKGFVIRLVILVEVFFKADAFFGVEVLAADVPCQNA